MINELIKLANALDESGFNKEADQVDLLIVNASDCSSIKDKYDKLHGEYRDKLESAIYRGCIAQTVNIHEFTPGENYNEDEGCKPFIDEVEAAYVAQKAAGEKYTSKCGPVSSPAGGNRCRSQVNAYNEAFEALDALVVKHREECYKQRKNQNYWTNDNQNKCSKLQNDICVAERRTRLVLINAREACGCKKEGSRTCRGFEQGGRFRLPGVWSTQSHCEG